MIAPVWRGSTRAEHASEYAAAFAGGELVECDPVVRHFDVDVHVVS